MIEKSTFFLDTGMWFEKIHFLIFTIDFSKGIIQKTGLREKEHKKTANR